MKNFQIILQSLIKFLKFKFYSKRLKRIFYEKLLQGLLSSMSREREKEEENFSH